MARRSLRVSEGASSARSSSKRPTPPASNAGLNGPKTKRAKYQTPSKKNDEMESEALGESSESQEDDEDEEASGYDESSESNQSDDDPTEEEDFSEEDEAPRRRKSTGKKTKTNNSKATSTTTLRTKGTNDISRPGTKTGLGPGTQVIMKKPRARSPGDTPYTDETIHPNTMLFLEELAANNDRQWLKSTEAPISHLLKGCAYADYFHSA